MHIIAVSKVHPNETGSGCAVAPSAGNDLAVDQNSVELVRISSLVLTSWPRLSGEIAEHSRLLAELNDNLPPILVHRRTMRVIDGMHRVRAAQLRGRSHIAAGFFDGSERDAFVLAVREKCRAWSAAVPGRPQGRRGADPAVSSELVESYGRRGGWPFGRHRTHDQAAVHGGRCFR